jgi:RNA-binding protein 5/10
VDPQFPFIQVPPPASHGASATAAFHKALKTGGQHSGRRVKIDYSQSANPNAGGRSGRLANANDGTRDIGNSPAAILLFRGLDPLSGPQAIELAMRTSSGPHKEGAKGMKRIILIKDKTTLASWGFAFVEFVDVQAASAVLAASMSPQIHPNGFRISDRPVATSFAHPYSFQPVSDPIMRDEACLPSSMTLGGVEDQWVRYWDEGATIAKLEYEAEIPMQQPAPTKEKEKKKKKAADIAPAVPAEASTLPVSDKPVTLSFKGGSKPTNLTSTPASSVAAASTLGFSMTDEGDPDVVEGDRAASNEDPKVAAAKKVAPLIASKKTANNITKWNQVQEVLSTGLPTSSTPEVAAPTKVAPPEAKPTPPPVVLPEEVEFEFSDLVKIACLLCARQFKTLDQLKKHNKESELHKRNFKDANLRDVARGKAKAAQAAAETNSAQASGPKYRDRASERRIMHNQPDVPLPEGVEDKRKQRRAAEGPTRPPTPPPPPINPGKDESNVGNKLLRMMGWKEGTGLGVDGEGRVDPVQTAIYATGVGLGASKGKEVGKYQEGYAGYVNMAKDSARERYES